MQIHFEDKFLSKGSTSLPPGNWVAAAIHPSSEVDLCFVGSNVLGVRSVVPCKPGMQCQAIRGTNQIKGAPPVAQDGNFFPGDKLVLALYEPGDVALPLGPRNPYITMAQITAAALPTTAAAALLAFRLPFSGRNHATVFAQRNSSAAGLSLVFRGVRYAYRNSSRGLFALAAMYEESTDSWSVATSTVDGNELLAKSYHFGGQGDLVETWDEIEVWCYGAAGGDALLIGETAGERVR